MQLILEALALRRDRKSCGMFLLICVGAYGKEVNLLAKFKYMNCKWW